MRYDKNVDYFEMWFCDKNAMLATMHSNIKSDLQAGYNPNGDIIKSQKAMIDEYKRTFEKQLLDIATMTENAANKWCYYDMRMRGVIE